jgi:hypothetical protein
MRDFESGGREILQRMRLGTERRRGGRDGEGQLVIVAGGHPALAEQAIFIIDGCLARATSPVHFKSAAA